VVFEFKSAIREEATIHNAFEQLTLRYKRDIPELFKYNAFCVISDGINNKAGSFFAPRHNIEDSDTLFFHLFWTCQEYR
jgi:type I restriction enzyme R subunit